MAEMYKITVTDQEGNIVKEAEAAGYLICAYRDKKEIGNGVKACGNVLVSANNISDAEVAATMACEETPLGRGHKLLNDMHKKRTAPIRAVWKARKKGAVTCPDGTPR